MYTLEETRKLDDATRQNSEGRYYRLKPDGDRNVRVYGFWTQWGGAYVCYTCGHVCDCGGEE